MNVIIHYNKSKKEANKLSKEANVETIFCDFSKTDSIKKILEDLEDRFEDVDVLIHNASYFQNGNLENTTLKNWEAHVKINLTAPFLLTKMFLKNCKKKKKTIIGMVDRRALKPGKQHLAYTVSESGLVSFLDIVSNTYENVKTGLVVMGPILPPKSGTLEDFENQVKKSPEKKAGTLEEINAAVIRIINSENDKIKIPVGCRIQNHDE